MYANQTAFDSPDSYRMAMGVDLRTSKAIVDLQGNVLAFAQTGGMISPVRFVMQPGSTIFRFGKKGIPASEVIKGVWWVEQKQFERLESL